MEKLIVAVITLLCPYLEEMAKKTQSPIDDLVVKLICSLVTLK